jgi:predicted enzyme related to lactoylglutathione lyase
MMTPRLYRVILPVRDIETAVKFYSGLFEMKGQRVSSGRHYFDLGGTILAVYDPVADGDPAEEWKHHPYQYVYIAVSDVDASYLRARALGATLLSERVESMPWGERLFYARDPSGNPICLVDGETLFLGEGE